MDESNYQNKEIIKYLLGSLNDADAEKFDELSFTDDKFAAALDAAEKDLIDGYVRGELGGETLEKFKSHYLTTSLRCEKVGFAETLQIYAEREAAKKSEKLSSAEVETIQNSALIALRNFFGNVSAALRWSFAVAALLITIGGGFWILNRRNPGNEIARQNPTPTIETTKLSAPPTGQNSNGETPSVSALPENKFRSNEAINKNAKVQSNVAPTRTPEAAKTVAPPKISVATFVLTPSLRSGGQISNLSIPVNTTDIKMRLELETDDFSAYHVVLTDESGAAKIWQSNKITAAGKGENKFLIVRFPAKLLKSKIYSLAVSGVNLNGGAEIIGNYSFRAVKK